MARRHDLFLAAGMAAVLSLAPAGTPAARGADTPEGAMEAVLDAFVAKDLDALGPLVCESQRETILAALDLTGTLAAEGFDAQLLLDALTLEIADRQVTLVSQEGDTAVVRLTGTMSMSFQFDEEALRAIVVSALEAAGMTVTEDLIQTFLPELMAMFSETQTDTVDEQIDVVLENGEWLVCDDVLGDGPDASAGPSPMASPGVAPSMAPGASPAM